MPLSYRPFRPLGTTQLEQFRQSFSDACATWADRWIAQSGSAPVLDIVCEVASPEVVSADARWLEYGTGQGIAYLSLPEAACIRFLEGLLGAESPPSGLFVAQTSEYLLARMFGDLFRRLPSGSDVNGQAAAGGVSQKKAALPSEALLPFSGAIHARLGLSSGPASVIFDGDLVRAVLPSTPSTRTSAPRVRLTEAVRSARKSVKVKAPADSKLSIEALGALSAGDVLLLQPTLSDSWELVTDEGAHVAHCSIGRRADKRAVQLIEKRM